MAVAKVECPECGAVLRPAKPLTPGKKVRCPRCENPFVVPGGDGEGDGPEGAGGKITTAPKKSRAKPPPAPEERKPAAAHDEDEGGTYRFLDEPGAQTEEEEEEKKPKIEYVPNLEVKDPRGPATAALATPSSFILLLGALMCVGGLLGVCISLWPFFFTKYGTGVAPSQAKKEYDRKHPKKQDEKAGAKKEDKEDDTWVDEEKVAEEVKKNSEMQAIWDEMIEEDTTTRIIWAVGCFVGLIYGGVMAMAAVKMTNLESYRWSMTASIMAMISVLGLPFGLLSLTQLKRDEIKAAFEYVSE